MVFPGHSDDEIISCGAIILKYQELGFEVIIIVVTSGKAYGGHERS